MIDFEIGFCLVLTNIFLEAHKMSSFHRNELFIFILFPTVF